MLDRHWDRTQKADLVLKFKRTYEIKTSLNADTDFAHNYSDLDLLTGIYQPLLHSNAALVRIWLNNAQCRCKVYPNGLWSVCLICYSANEPCIRTATISIRLAQTYRCTKTNSVLTAELGTLYISFTYAKIVSRVSAMYSAHRSEAFLMPQHNMGKGTHAATQPTLCMYIPSEIEASMCTLL